MSFFHSEKGAVQIIVILEARHFHPILIHGVYLIMYNIEISDRYIVLAHSCLQIYTSMKLFTSVNHNSDTVRYCFGPVIEKELNQIVIEWNHHYVRKSTTAEAPGGIPNVLYLIPETTGILVFTIYITN